MRHKKQVGRPRRSDNTEIAPPYRTANPELSQNAEELVHASYFENATPNPTPS